MLEDSNPFQIVFDKRNAKKVALMTEFNSEKSFAEETDIWTDQPSILSSKEVQHHFANNSAIYHLSQQNVVMHIVSEYDITVKQCTTTFRFFQDHQPYEELEKSRAHCKTRGKRARAIMMKDLRTEIDQ